MYVPGGEAAPNQCAGGTAGEVPNPGGNTIGGAPGTGDLNRLRPAVAR